MKKTVALALLAAGIATLASARNRTHTAEARYRIDLAGNTVILARDLPVARGSVLMFHRSSDGVLTSVPSEEVASVRRLSAEQVIPVAGTARRGSGALAGGQPLHPGQAIVLGTTGDGAPIAPGAIAPASGSGSQANIQGRQVLDNQVFPGDLPAPGANGAAPGTPGYVAPSMATSPSTATNPSMAINPTLNPAGNAAAATATTGVGANGFPATGAATPINPNGFPATTTTGPQSGAQPIDPNGYPSLATPPSTSASPAAGTNAAPATGTSPSTTSAAPKTSSSTATTTSAAPASGAKSGGSGH